MLQKTGPRNVRFSHCRTAMTQPASRKKRKLKYVQTFLTMICCTVAPGGSTGRLSQPPARRSCTCSPVSPSSGSASTAGISTRCGRSGSFGFRFRNDAATNAVLLQVIIDIISHLRQNLSTKCIFSEKHKKRPQRKEQTHPPMAFPMRGSHRGCANKKLPAKRCRATNLACTFYGWQIFYGN